MPNFSFVWRLFRQTVVSQMGLLFALTTFNVITIRLVVFCFCYVPFTCPFVLCVVLFLLFWLTYLGLRISTLFYSDYGHLRLITKFLRIFTACFMPSFIIPLSRDPQSLSRDLGDA